MFKKFFGFVGKLFQGAGRLLLTVLLFVAALLVSYLIIQPIFITSQIGEHSPLTSGHLSAPFFAFALCIVIQIIWDVLDIGILDNIVGRIIKRILFFIALGLGVIMALTFYSESFTSPEIGDLGFFGKGLTLAFVFVPSVTAVIYTLVIVKDEDKSIGPWIPLYTWGGSVILGLVLSLLYSILPGFVSWFPTIVLFGAIAFMVIYMIKEKTFIFADGGYSYSSGSGRSSSSYSPSYYDDSDDTPSDTRSTDLFGMLKGDFYHIASNHSTSHSLGYGASVLFDISMNTYGNSVVFTVNGRLYNADSFSSQYEVDTATSNLQSATKTVMQRVYNDAERAIKAAQDKYTDYEQYELTVEPGNIY